MALFFFYAFDSSVKKIWFASLRPWRLPEKRGPDGSRIICNTGKQLATQFSWATQVRHVRALCVSLRVSSRAFLQRCRITRLLVKVESLCWHSLSGRPDRGLRVGRSVEKEQMIPMACLPGKILDRVGAGSRSLCPPLEQPTTETQPRRLKHGPDGVLADGLSEDLVYEMVWP